MTVQYITAADMALILKYGTANQGVVAGLNNMGPPGLERASVEVTEFRNAFSRQFAGGAKQTNITFSGNYVSGDTNGQDQLRTYLINNTAFTDARLYLNYNTSNLDSDFVACDTVNDSSSAWQVIKHGAGAADINGVIPFNGELVCNGQNAWFFTHYSADTIAFVDSDPDTITDSASGFVTAGFEAGQTLIVEGTTNNDGIYLIETVVAGTITLQTSDSLAAETAGTSFTLHGGKQ
jgi:hypothetical protein